MLAQTSHSTPEGGLCRVSNTLVFGQTAVLPPDQQWRNVMFKSVVQLCGVVALASCCWGCGGGSPPASDAGRSITDFQKPPTPRAAILTPPEALVSEEEIRSVMGHVGPVTATEAAAVVLARRMMDIDELRASRASDYAKGVLQTAINDVRKDRPELPDDQAREAALRLLEQQAMNIDDRILQNMQRDLVITSPSEARALIRTRRRMALAQRSATTVAPSPPLSDLPGGNSVRWEATLTYWRKFIELGKEAEAGLGKSPKGKEVGASVPGGGTPDCEFTDAGRRAGSRRAFREV